MVGFYMVNHVVSCRGSLSYQLQKSATALRDPVAVATPQHNSFVKAVCLHPD